MIDTVVGAFFLMHGGLVCLIWGVWLGTKSDLQRFGYVFQVHALLGLVPSVGVIISFGCGGEYLLDLTRNSVST